MTERLVNLVIGLQRLMEGARTRGDDLKYAQQQEDQEHVQYLDHLISWAARLHGSLLEERRRFVPVKQAERVEAEPQDAIPKFVQKGPAIK